MNGALKISIIIPAANEAEALPLALARIKGPAHETIVVDAESDDGTPAIAESLGCKVLAHSQRHRARQMNRGALEARGAILLFLHADTWLPSGALAKIIDAIERRGAIGGGFTRRYRSRSLTLALTSRLAGLRNRLIGWHLGDQALFVRRDLFEKIGGYRDLPIFEDLDFSRRLRAAGKTVTLTPPVQTSPRRFEARGPLRTTWDDLLLTRKFISGKDPNELCLSPRTRLKSLQTYERLS
ncbi:MAG: TIGR04283 family arsenosugar biosynthesis glycosyltransferase [Spartobacteria bacterium]